MSFTLPNPTSPNTQDPLTSLPIKQNFSAISAALNALDGSGLASKSVQESSLADAINPRLMQTNAGISYVVTGFAIAPSTTTAITVTSGTAYVSGYYVISIGGSVTVPTNQDSYIDITTVGQLTVSSVPNNAASPVLQPSTLRLAKVICGATGSVQTLQSASNTAPVAPNTQNWFGFDSLGNAVYNTDPNSRTVGYAEFIPGTLTTSNVYVDTPYVLNLTIPTGVTRIKLSADMTVSSNATNINYFQAICDGANNIIIERSWPSVNANASQLGFQHLERYYSVTQGTIYNFKLRHHTDGTNIGVINNNNPITMPTIIRAERA